MTSLSARGPGPVLRIFRDFLAPDRGWGPRAEEQGDLGAAGRDAVGAGDVHPIGVVGRAGEGEVEDRVGEVGDGEQVAVVGGVVGLLGPRVLDQLAAGEDPVAGQGRLVAPLADPLAGVGAMRRAFRLPLQVDGDRRAAGGSNLGRKRTGCPGSAPVRSSPAWIWRGTASVARIASCSLVPFRQSRCSRGPSRSTTRARRTSRLPLGSNQRLGPSAFQDGSGRNASAVGLRRLGGGVGRGQGRQHHQRDQRHGHPPPGTARPDVGHAPPARIAQPTTRRKGVGRSGAGGEEKTNRSADDADERRFMKIFALFLSAFIGVICG